MSERSWALLCLIAILIVAGKSALIVFALALAFLLLKLVIQLLMYVLKRIFRWVFR